MPIGIQRKRAKGWRLPEGAVCVSRGTRWGNPWSTGAVVRVLRQAARLSDVRDDKLFAVAMQHPDGAAAAYAFEGLGLGDDAARIAVTLYRQAVEHFHNVDPEGCEVWLAPLRGKDLACWCEIGRPCHRDVLLDWANRAERFARGADVGAVDDPMFLPHRHVPMGVR